MTLTLSLLKIPVTDLSRATSFYSEALGLEAVFTSVEYGWTQFDGPGPGLALYVPGKGGGDRAPGGSLDFHLASDSLDALLERAAAVAPDASIHANADGSRSLEFTDPDGNVVKIMGNDT
ncbi:MAG: VOC family protein [Pseudomonadota bacterium]